MNKGAQIANEEAFRKAVLDKLDRIIELLGAPQTFHYHYGPPQTLPSYSGYQCQICKAWVPFGTTHMCAGSPNVT